MGDFFAQLSSQIRAIWARLDTGQRLTIGAVVLATVVGIGAIVWYSGQPDYRVVFHSEDPRELSTAARALTQAGIAFKREGASLLVDTEERGAASAALIDAGVSGLQDPEKDDALTSMTLDRTARLDALAAKNAKRARYSLMQIDGVLGADVRFNKPKRSPWAAQDEENKPRASVVLKLRRGESFFHIARSAVDVVSAALGVPPEHVVVIDAHTKQRYRSDMRSGSGIENSEFLLLQRRRSEQMTERAQALLDRVYPDKAQVLVTVELDPSWEMRREKLVGEKVLVREKTTKDNTSGGGAAGGDPSASTFTGTNASGAGSAAPATASTTSETKDREYEPFTGEKTAGKLAPDVKKVSISLILDESVGAAKRKEIEDVVKRAVGWENRNEDPTKTRVDEFAVLVEKLPPPQEPPQLEGADPMVMVEKYGPIAGQVIAVLLVVLFLRGLLKKSAAAAARRLESTRAEDVEIDKIDKEELPPEEVMRRIRQELERSIAENPAAISRMIEGWLAEQRS